MKRLIIDPASKDTGWALFEGSRAVDCGKLHAPADPTRWPAHRRIDHIVSLLLALLDEHDPQELVIETTTGKVNRNRHGGGGAGMSIYGWALGALRQAAIGRLGPDRVHSVLENEWTKRLGTKDRRRMKAGLLFRSIGYDPEQDKGGDVADALLLGEWWVQKQRMADRLRA